MAQGIKKIKLEPVQSVIIDADDIFNDLENDRKKGLLAQKVTSARIYYEASQKRVGFLDRIDSATGKRETGKFENGRFRAF